MKNIIKKWWFWLVIIVLVLAIIIGVREYNRKKAIKEKWASMGQSITDFYEGTQNAEGYLNEFNYNYETGKVEYNPTENNTWLYKYNLIEEGMTVNEVVQILGEGYITPGINDTEYFMNWGTNEGLEEGQVITIQFNDEKVHLKTQIGLD